MALLVSTWHTSLTSVEGSYFSHHGVYFFGSWKAGKGKTTLMAGRKYIVCLPSTRLSFFPQGKWLPHGDSASCGLTRTRCIIDFIMAVLVFPYQKAGTNGKWPDICNLVVRKYFPSTLLVYYTFCLVDERSSWYNVYVTFLGIDCASWSTYLI